MTKFTVSAKALTTIARLAKAIEVDAVRLKASKDCIETVLCNKGAIFLGAARFEIQDGPAEPIDVTMDMRRLLDTAKAMGGSPEPLKVELAGSLLKFSLGRKKRIVATDAPIGEPQALPKVQPPVRIEVPVSFLKEGISGSSGIEDSMRFIVQDGQLLWRTEGKVGELYEDAVAATDVEAVRAMFQVAFLADMVKLMEGETCILHLGTDLPLKAEFVVEGGTATFFLAPVIGEE